MWHLKSGIDEETETLCHRIIGACIEVHRHLGPGLSELVYEEALCLELALRQIPFERQLATRIEYKGVEVGSGRLDLLVARKVVVELKALESLARVHTLQAVTYLKATGCQLALLVNFNTVRLRDGIKRVVHTP
jgi:GxxExxY protein